MLRSMLIVAAALFLVPAAVHAQAVKAVQVSGVVGGSNLVVSAINQGGNLVGTGKLTAWNGTFYNLKVQSGAVVQNRYVTLQGVILAPNGAVAAAFTLNGDRTTGAILFMYGNVKQSAKGTVMIQ